MFDLKKISFYYEKDKVILNDITLKLEKNEFYIIMGENGSGKSTLLMLLKGINKLKSGEFYFKNRKILASDIKKSGFIPDIGFVFQDPDTQIVGLDVKSDIAFGPLNLGWDDLKVNEKVAHAMEECDITHLQNKNPYLLSYGEKKRVSIAGILAMEPEVLILDEPTTWLDPWHKKQLKEILNKQKNMNKTIILSTHDVEFAKEINCKYIFLKEGTIAAQGGLELFNDIELLKKCKLF